MQALTAQGFPLTIEHSAGGSSSDALLAELRRLLQPNPDHPLADLPLVEISAPPTSDTFAIFFSGDGGWRDLDQSVSETLQSKGISVVGINSLRYFWSRKGPDVLARDIAEIVRTYGPRWRAENVVLIGYSFGADILPAAFNALDSDTRSRVVQISLLGFAAVAQFEMTVTGWLNFSDGSGEPTLPQVSKIDPSLLQCFYGADEDGTACPSLEGTGAEVIKTAGDHHFDGNYPGLADTIAQGLQDRLSRRGIAGQNDPAQAAPSLP